MGADTPSPTPSFVEVNEPRTSEEDFQAGVAVLAYGDEEPDAFREKSAAALDRLAELHVNSVSFVFPVVQGDWRATEIGPDPERTPSDEAIRAFIEEAERRGFTVLLRPVLDEESLTPDGKWRGSIEPSDLDAWFASYGRLMKRYAQLSAEAGADILAVGTELTSLQDEAERWRRLIREVRRVFDGQITYATNWDAIGPAYAPTFVGALDFLSVDAFFPLEVGEAAAAGEMARGWRPWLRELRRMGPALRNVVFTEVGVRAQRGAHLKPYVWEHGGETDPETQRRYYAATCRAVGEEIGGLYWWVVDIHHAVEAEAVEDFSPMGKPAEEEMARCFRSVA
ncbi:MAG TPA: hypothetical protein VF058_09115 [Actinomycetota bacterium]